MVHFTDREALTMRNILEAMGNNTPEVRQLKEKLARLYDDEILQGHRTNTMFGLNLNNLYRAIRDQRVCILHDYRSSRSATVTNRTVEPFQLLSDNEDVRCYEPVSGICKTFKVERIGHVSVIEDVKWSYADKHKTFHTDLFHFSSEEQHSVTVQMDGLAAQLLREEYPVSEEELAESDSNLWTLKTDVCSWKGIGRFVLGLMGNIISVEPAEFRGYLQTQIDEHKSFIQ